MTGLVSVLSDELLRIGVNIRGRTYLPVVELENAEPEILFSFLVFSPLM